MEPLSTACVVEHLQYVPLGLGVVALFFSMLQLILWCWVVGKGGYARTWTWTRTQTQATLTLKPAYSLTILLPLPPTNNTLGCAPPSVGYC